MPAQKKFRTALVVAACAAAPLSAQNGSIYAMDMDAGQQCQAYFGGGPGGIGGGGGQIGAPAGYRWGWPDCGDAAFTHPCPADPFEVGWFHVVGAGTVNQLLRYSRCCEDDEVGIVNEVWLNGVYIRLEHVCRDAAWPY